MDSIEILCKKIKESILEDQRRLLHCQIECDALCRLRDSTSTAKINQLEEGMNALQSIVEQLYARLRQCQDVCTNMINESKSNIIVNPPTVNSNQVLSLASFKVSNDTDCIDLDDFIANKSNNYRE